MVKYGWKQWIHRSCRYLLARIEDPSILWLDSFGSCWIQSSGEGLYRLWMMDRLQDRSITYSSSGWIMRVISINRIVQGSFSILGSCLGFVKDPWWIFLGFLRILYWWLTESSRGAQGFFGVLEDPWKWIGILYWWRQRSCESSPILKVCLRFFGFFYGFQDISFEFLPILKDLLGFSRTRPRSLIEFQGSALRSCGIALEMSNFVRFCSVLNFLLGSIGGF